MILNELNIKLPVIIIKLVNVRLREILFSQVNLVIVFQYFTLF